jgi:Asp-tRNA(Asn)/Glu-tRNA(Gln) amidotransferase C subunit
MKISGMLFTLLERLSRLRFNKGDLENFRPQMWEILNF